MLCQLRKPTARCPDPNSYTCVCSFTNLHCIYRVAQKSKPLPNYKKLCLTVLKSDNEFRFLRQVKEMIKHYNIIHRY